MKVAVLSGKGGTGKTFVSVNLAAVAGRAVYVDCDVEEPNGNLFLPPESTAVEPVETLLPSIDAVRCTACRACVDFCRFGALAYAGGTVRVLPSICHSCGGCALVCPAGAVNETVRAVGRVERGRHGMVSVVTGVLNPGEASGIPVIRAALRYAAKPEAVTVIDCPPGSACAVMECIAVADCCLLVTEPTAFGLHNLRMVAELAALLGKPRGIIENRARSSYTPLNDYARASGIPILARIPYSEQIAQGNAEGKLACEHSAISRRQFNRLLRLLETGACV